MGILTVQKLVQQLKDTRAPAVQATLLQKLKTEIVGHPLRKRECIEHGALSWMVAVLKAHGNSFGKVTHHKLVRKSTRRDASPSQQAAFLGAVEVTTVLANGESKFDIHQCCKS